MLPRVITVANREPGGSGSLGLWALPLASQASDTAALCTPAGTVTFVKSIKEVSETWTDQAGQIDPLSISKRIVAAKPCFPQDSSFLLQRIFLLCW